MTAVLNVEKFYERLNRFHAHFVKHRYVDVLPPLLGFGSDNYDKLGGSEAHRSYRMTDKKERKLYERKARKICAIK